MTAETLASRPTVWAENSGRLRGAAEALIMLRDHPVAVRQRACQSGLALLLRYACPVDWRPSGLPVSRSQFAVSSGTIPISDKSVTRLARASMELYCAGLLPPETRLRWARLERFCASYLPSADPELAELRQRARRLEPPSRVPEDSSLSSSEDQAVGTETNVRDPEFFVLAAARGI